MILHCMKKDLWEERQHKGIWGKSDIEADGFVHCATPEFFWRVCHKFNNSDAEYVIVCIDEEKLISPVKYEEKNSCGRKYPHIYGLVNNDAVFMTLPYLKDNTGNWVKNKELENIENK